jgi:LysR family glycine cleavage system transcriptional activator
MGILQNAVGAFAASAERDPLVVSMEPHFATRWLPSRLPRLLADPAGANLQLITEDRRADFVTDGVDMGIRYGAGRWEGLESAHLFTDTLFPVCSPAFAAAHPLRGPQDLLQAPLVHHGHRPWTLWFEALGIPAPPIRGPVLDDSAMVIEAAAQGMGVALARSGLIEGDLASGRLVRPFHDAVCSGIGFHVVWRADSRKIARIEALRDWLVAEVRASGEQETEAA